MFSKIIKNINLNSYMILTVNINQIKAQYNPDRFKFWKSLYEGPEEEVLNMLYSPHCRFLDQYIKQNNLEVTSYYKLQKLYGRNHKWIKNKINKFINLFEDIKKNGCLKKIIILTHPLVKNIYNNSFEIYEGHHRYSCLVNLGTKEIKCKVIENG